MCEVCTRTCGQVVRSFPFSSAKKRMSTLVRTGGGEARLYTKVPNASPWSQHLLTDRRGQGASEIIAGMCKSYMAKDGSTQVPLADACKALHLPGQM